VFRSVVTPALGALSADGLLQNKRSATTLPKPENWGSMGQEERQRWESESTVAPSIRPVHYSNVQLCVEENGADRYERTRPPRSLGHKLDMG
jgi:large subunit ribosomal protein L24